MRNLRQTCSPISQKRLCSSTGFIGPCLLAVLLTWAAAPALAIDARKTALALAVQAASAFESGDMDKASQLYLEAWHTDPGEPNFLYGAARAEQSAGQRDRAEEHYRQFVAMPKADPARVSKANGYLNEFDGVRADDKVQAADRAAKRGEWIVAATGYSEAWKLRQDRVPLLLRSARAWRESGDLKQTQGVLETYLKLAPKDAVDRSEAQAMLDALRGKKQSAATAAKPPPESRPPAAPAMPPQEVRQLPVTAAPPAVAVAAESPHATRRLIGWLTLGTGVAVTAVGVGVLVSGLSQESDYEKRLGWDGGSVAGTMSFDEATAEAGEIAGRKTLGAVLAGVGLATTAAGALLVVLSPAERVAVVPSLRGVALAGRF